MNHVPFFHFGCAACCVVFLSACQSVQLGDQGLADAKISPLSTFEVGPVGGQMDRILPGETARLDALTRQTITEQLEAKGYTQAVPGQPPQFTVYPQWMVTTQNNEVYQLNRGDFETATQVPALSQAASVNLAVQQSDSGQFVWRGDSPWPVGLNRLTEAGLRTLLVQALTQFPVHVPAGAQPLGAPLEPVSAQ